ncbi:hypothetical protein AT251_20455 [Enterovibrio nigricans]|nr:hypothetical protein [Enterovibrio nigricans]PKF49223.1 hypothetical protein AT251_20455 [Enterovibrio nigricans]
MTETHTTKGATPPPFSLDDTTFSDDLLADIEALEPSQPKRVTTQKTKTRNVMMLLPTPSLAIKEN